MHNLFLCMIAHMWNQLPTINKSSTTLAKFRSLLNNDVKFQYRVPVHELYVILAVFVYFSMLLGLVYIFNIILYYILIFFIMSLWHDRLGNHFPRFSTLNKVTYLLRYLLTKQCQDFRPSAAPLYPNMSHERFFQFLWRLIMAS